MDVTQSCRSSNNSGVQVVTRNLFREINNLHDITPIIWDNLLGKYALLNYKEKKNLSDPFSGSYQAKTRPNKQENPFHKELLSTFLRLKRSLSLRKEQESETFIFFPEVFRDKRVTLLSNLLHPLLAKAAIFHDANVLRKPSQTPASRIQNFRTYLDFVGNCDAVSCVSKDSLDTLCKLTDQKRAVKHIKVHHLPAEKTRSVINLNNKAPPLILFVSTLGYNKNHLALLKAAEMLWKEGLNFTIELIGQADPSWTPKVLVVLDDLIKKGRSVKWLHHVDQNTLEEKYSKCLFTVYPSLFEGFGLPIVESLIRGKPCICGTNGALGEVSNGGGCLEVKDQREPNQLAEAIRKLISDETLRKTLASQAQKRVFGTWKQYASELMDFFLKVKKS